MKIAFIGQPWDTSLPSRGGPMSSIDIWIEQVARRLAQQGHQVIVYCPARRFNLRMIRETRRGIGYRGMRAVRAEGKLFNTVAGAVVRHNNPKRPPFTSPLYYAGYTLQVALDLKQQQCDIIHVSNLLNFIPTIRKYNPKAKIVLHMHCEWLSQLDRAFVEPRMRQADLILGCSTHITNLAVQCFPEYKQMFDTIFNGVDPQDFVYRPLEQSQNSRPTILFVGRISPEKEPHRLIEAYLRVQQRIPDVRLELIGPEVATPKEFIVSVSEDPNVMNLAKFYDPAYIQAASYPHYLKNMIPAHLEEQVTFVGNLPHADMVSHYHAATVLALPSVSEAFGIPLVEAMACGRPVVAARTGGMTDIVDDGKTGFLVEPANAEALAQALLTILENPELQKRMGEAGMERARNLFTWEQTAQNYQRLASIQ